MAAPGLVLSLFPGIGLLDMAFEEAGFCVVRGPDLLWGGDVKGFHPPAGVFDGVIGGPPCQCFSRLRSLVEHNGHAVAENLIPEFERCVGGSACRWFLMENVPGAPRAAVAGYAVTALLLDNREMGAEQQRERRFSFGVRGCAGVSLERFLEVAALRSATRARAVLASGSWYGGEQAERRAAVVSERTGKRRVASGFYKRGPCWEGVREAVRLQGLPDGFLDGVPFTAAGAQRVIGNGVPLPMGRAIAAAVKGALASLPVGATS